jgi:orotidine 5'-phosphate decarboxylase subfamily 2
MSSALQKLQDAQKRTGSLLSVGLEPSLDYLPKGFSKNLEGCEEFLNTIIEATSGLVSAYKFNLAFFESHGWEGMELLYTIREKLPEDVLIIADAKRSDIGTSAQHYAKALYENLQVDSATVNPMMGRDSVEPFLRYEDKLTFFLVLTSNPGAADFILPDALYRNIAKKLQEWGTPENCGFVVGATRPELLGEVRSLSPQTTFLIPGLGAQSGAIEETLKEGTISEDNSGMVLHVTRGILPGKDESGDVGEIIHRKTKDWVERLNAARPKE